jgi:hypothetical protein
MTDSTMDHTPGAPLGQMAGTTTVQGRGTFEVTLTPLATYHDAADAHFGRRSIDKRFAGDLEGTSRGEMITAGTAVQGSIVYSALERIEGTFAGRRGAFTVQHTGVMARGAESLSIVVVPDSGTGELTGIAGTMGIEMVERQHHYTFEFTLPER